MAFAITTVGTSSVDPGETYIIAPLALDAARFQAAHAMISGSISTIYCKLEEFHQNLERNISSIVARDWNYLGEIGFLSMQSNAVADTGASSLFCSWSLGGTR